MTASTESFQLLQVPADQRFLLQTAPSLDLSFPATGEIERWGTLDIDDPHWSSLRGMRAAGVHRYELASGFRGSGCGQRRVSDQRSEDVNPCHTTTMPSSVEFEQRVWRVAPRLASLARGTRPDTGLPRASPWASRVVRKGGTRTPTVLRPPAPQAGASANSATFARGGAALKGCATRALYFFGVCGAGCSGAFCSGAFCSGAFCSAGCDVAGAGAATALASSPEREARR